MNHTYTDWQQKAYKINAGRIYIMKSDNDYPYELKWQILDRTYAWIPNQHMDQYNDHHTNQYLINTKINIWSPYITIYETVELTLLYNKFRYLLLFMETAERDVKQKQTDRSQSELDEVTTDKKWNSNPVFLKQLM